MSPDRIPAGPVTVLVTTYNWPAALTLVLRGLAEQTVRDFRVLICDDGSGPETRRAIETLRRELPFDVEHLWQEDDGFRAATARNLGLAHVQSGYVIFLDGDCIPRTDFIERHIALAEPGWFVAGNRVLLRKDFSRRVLDEGLPIWQTPRQEFTSAQINRRLPLLSLPLGPLRKTRRRRWQGAITCNLGVWYDDAVRVNGFDERYQGWGHEDADFVVRLMRSGVLRKEGRFAVPVLHLWHRHNDRAAESTNRQRLQQILDSDHTVAGKGLTQHQ